MGFGRMTDLQRGREVRGWCVGIAAPAAAGGSARRVAGIVLAVEAQASGLGGCACEGGVARRNEGVQAGLSSGDFSAHSKGGGPLKGGARRKRAEQHCSGAAAHRQTQLPPCCFIPGCLAATRDSKHSKNHVQIAG